MRRCPKCALDNDVDSKFCIGCGASLAARSAVASSLGDVPTMGDEATSHSSRSKGKKEEKPPAKRATPQSLGDSATIGFDEAIIPLPRSPESIALKKSPIAEPRRGPIDSGPIEPDQTPLNSPEPAERDATRSDEKSDNPAPEENPKSAAASEEKVRAADPQKTDQLAKAARATHDAFAGAWSRRETFARGAGTRIGAVLNSAIQAMKFYWINCKLLWRTFVVYVPALEDSNVRTRELHLSSDHDFDGVKLRENGWSVRLPECCVVCGESTENDWIRETREVDQMTWPLWSGIGGFALGLLMLFWWSYWLIPLFGFLGLWLGYWGRSQMRVKLKYQRCDRHIEKVEFPGVRVAPKLLIVEVGKRAVKTKFLDSQRDLLPGLRPDEFV